MDRWAGELYLGHGEAWCLDPTGHPGRGRNVQNPVQREAETQSFCACPWNLAVLRGQVLRAQMPPGTTRKV